MSRTVWIVAVVAWIAAAAVAFVYRHTLLASISGTLALITLCLPVAFALYVLAEGLGEGVASLLLLVAFKVVTLGLIRTEFTAEAMSFPWYGFARTRDLHLVASEGAVAVIGVLVYTAIGVIWYFAHASPAAN
jgi:hypothetical protein